MENVESVFKSSKKRNSNQTNSNLYELLDIVPVQPVTEKKLKPEKYCNFYPNTNKKYVQKKHTKLKVRTVRDIRRSFEEDTYEHLKEELSTQKNVVIRNIRGGLKNRDTILIANNMLKENSPISRTTWHMLMNINPEGHTNPKQYALCNGKYIQVNGSKGGRNKLISKYDLHKLYQMAIPMHNYETNMNKKIDKRKGLLQYSLNINFKPGPLRRKKNLDISHQKLNIGDTELIKLPKPRLIVQPRYGVTLDATINNIIHNLREENGLISENWAKFALGALGTTKNSTATQIDKESYASFDLNYIGDQRRIMMRRCCDDADTPSFNVINVEEIQCKEDESHTIHEIKNIINRIIDSVEINLQQDHMHIIEEEFSETRYKIIDEDIVLRGKGKKKFGELGRLDVTVAQLSDDLKQKMLESCTKPFCSMGCVCNSLNNRTSYPKEHCGNLECMFQCKCSFSKYKNALSGEESILLKTRKRNWKSSKKYADFYSNMCLKSKTKNTKILKIAIPRIDLKNIEPWCMVHNLYKCFCKGKFIESASEGMLPQSSIEDVSTEVNEVVSENDDTNETAPIPCLNFYKRRLCKENNALSKRKNSELLAQYCIPENPNNYYLNYMKRCSRIKPYSGRNHSNEYYRDTNNKIYEMEKNDISLRKKLNIIIRNLDDNQTPEKTKHSLLCHDIIHKTENMKSVDVENTDVVLPDAFRFSDFFTRNYLKDIEPDINHKQNNIQNKMISNEFQCTNEFESREDMVNWIGESYKLYNESIQKGILKVNMDPPVLGKKALYSWEFILSRYKERKNIFLVTTQMPQRIFLTINKNHPAFKNCINIDDIRFEELNKYPATIQNLLSNATDIKNNFCILRGTSICWEYIGSVTKLDGEASNNNSNSLINTSITTTNYAEKESSDTRQNNKPNEKNLILAKESNSNMHNLEVAPDSSKWFIMTLQNDFTEIKFIKKGFFVTSEVILQAINVARITGKTVRLSNQKAKNRNECYTPFGVYAMPNKNEHCVIVGPYEVEDSLQSDTVLCSKSDVNVKNRTKGFWMTTSKIDDLNVVSDPFQFIPPKEEQHTVNIPKSITSANLVCSVTENNKSSQEITQNIISPKKDLSKIVKPIKIRKVNGLYHLARNNLLQGINTHQLQLTSDTSSLLSKPLSIIKTPLDKPIYQLNTKISTSVDTSLDSLVPYSKITSHEEKPMSTESHTQKPRMEKGMFILKPEEINKKILDKVTSCAVPNNKNLYTINKNEEINKEIVDFIVNPDLESDLLQDEVCIISDSDDENTSNTAVIADRGENYKKVWIQCTNIRNLGWLKGRKRRDGKLSFALPGKPFTPFYIYIQALRTIRMMLSKRIYITKKFPLKWKVVTSMNDLIANKNMLVPPYLDGGYMLTKNGLKNIKHFKVKVRTRNVKPPVMSPEKTVDMVSSLIQPDDSNEENEDEFKLVWHDE